MNKLHLSIAFTIVVISLINPFKAFADTSCQPIYGGGQTCVTTSDIGINKTVLNPQTNQFVDNLGINDARYSPGLTTNFQISVTNTSNHNISKINVKDIFPQYIAFSSGPGNFDSNTKTLTFEVNNLAINETRTFTVLGKIADASQIPVDQGSAICVVNQATATNLDNSSQVTQDNAQLCIEKGTSTTTIKGGFPVLTTTPKTGPESLALLALIPTGISGLMLRKHAINKEVKS